MGNELPEVDDSLKHMQRETRAVFVEAISASMRPVEAVIRELSQSDVPVLLLAERGAGKHATAHRIHEISPRASQPFHALACSTLKPRDLEFANPERASAAGGTIFLNEIGELNQASQAALTEKLMEGTNSARLAPRFIFGSARDLDMEVKTGRVREDFYYRISGVCLRLPPLRQRKEDIPRLMEHFLGKYAVEFHRPVPELSPEMYRLFREYSWPGNLRELENAARLLVAVGDEQLAMGGLRALLQKPAERGNGVSLKAASRAASHEAEKALILKALTRTRWNRRRAAEELQISYKALLYKLKQIGYEGFGA
ncbi:MAG TPA: sigma 54-interacting transcriptional regulator [Dongiaceae bacterium]|nr:sigma 54-interacting transcriptional regulator [Dongiaceae bacterium]